MTRTRTFLTLVGEDNTQRAFRSVQGRLSGLERSAQKLSRTFGLLLGAGAITGAFRSIVETGQAFERFERQLTAATGSTEGAARELAFVRDEAERLGLRIDSVAGSYARLTAATRGTALEGRETREIFSAVAEASRVMNLSVSDTEGVLRALEQIISKGTVQAEELRGQLGERLPRAFNLAADAMGVTTAELNKLLQRGQVAADDLLPRLASQLREEFGGQVEAAANSASASFARLSTSIQDLERAIAATGAIDAVTALTDALAILARTAGEIPDQLRRTELEELNTEIGKTAAQIRDLDRRIQGLNQGEFAFELNAFLRGADIEDFKRRKAELEAELEDLFAQKNRRFPRDLEGLGKSLRSTARAQKLVADASRELSIELTERFRGGVRSTTGAIRVFSAANRELDRTLAVLGERTAAATAIIREIETPIERMIRRLGEARELLATGDLNEQQFARFKDILTDDVIEPLGELEEKSDSVFGNMEAIVDQAARNIQDTFADFLFDPFDAGLRGMAVSFANTLRRMAAEARAAELLGALTDRLGPLEDRGGFGRFFGRLFGFAQGGEFTVGGAGGVDSQLVAFRATPGEHVVVTPPGKGDRSVNVIQNNKIAFGNTVDAQALQRLRQELDRRDRQLTAQIAELVRRGQLV